MNMDKDIISSLLSRYNSGEATPEDMLMIERLIEKEAISLEDLDDVSKLDHQLSLTAIPEPSANLDNRFYSTLALEKKQLRRSWIPEWFAWPELAPRLAFAAVTFILGLAAGYLLLPKQTTSSPDITALSNEVNDLKEMMMLSLLEKGSATDRLKAVSLTGEFDKASDQVTRALIKTLSLDENVNVRLAALDALRPYTSNSSVRAEMIKAIAKQDSPLVQIALAELMAALQEKSAVKEFEKLLQNKNTPSEVKKRIREKMDVMI
jgi:hypothetical protein